jgi:hypothetical protein
MKTIIGCSSIRVVRDDLRLLFLCAFVFTNVIDKGASFGPFDRQVVILNMDGRTFTLLQNPQAMRLKKAGFIQDRRFVKQPTQEEMDAALAAEEGGFFEGAFKSIFGGADES